MILPKLSSRRWFALILLCATQFMVVLDFSIVNVALPSMQKDLGFSPQSLQWVVSAYALNFGGFLPLGGRAADLLGRRRVFMVGLGLFSLASLIGGLAQFQAVLILGRVFQGLGAAIISPAALSILTTTFKEGSERNRALGFWGGVTAIGFAAGMLLGGFLTDGLGWQWVMFVNVPIGLASLALAPVLLRESRDQTTSRYIDLAGAITITAGLITLVSALVQVPNANWGSSQIIFLFGISLVLLVLFVIIETHTQVPLVPLRIFRRRTLTGANLVALLMSAAATSMVFILTLYMQEVLSYSALQTGLAFLPNALAATFAAPFGSRVSTRIGVKSTVVGGISILMVGLLIFTRISVHGSFVRDLLPGMVVVGFGIILTLVAVSIAATTGVSDGEQGLASGLLNTAQQVGSALGLAIIVTVSTTRTQALLVTTGSSPTALRVAQTGGYQFALAVSAGIAAIGAIVALLVIRQERLPQKFQH